MFHWFQQQETGRAWEHTPMEGSAGAPAGLCSCKKKSAAVAAVVAVVVAAAAVVVVVVVVVWR